MRSFLFQSFSRYDVLLHSWLGSARGGKFNNQRAPAEKHCSPALGTSLVRLGSPASQCPATETMYSYLAHFQCRVRARRGDDVHAERCLRVGRDQALLESVLGSHVADFPFFSLPFVKLAAHAWREHPFGSSSPTRGPCAILGYPRPCTSPGTPPPGPRRGCLATSASCTRRKDSGRAAHGHP